MLRAGLRAPAASIREEETLNTGHTVNHRCVIQRLNTLLLQSQTVRLQRNRHAGQITNVLAQSQLTVHVELRVQTHRNVRVVLLHQRGGTLLELRVILLSPPALQLAVAVVAGTLIVKTVTNLVANNHADIAVVRRVVSIRVEVRGLQNSRREHNLVCRGHVVRVHGLRSHQPLRLIHRLAVTGNQPVGIKRTGAAQVLKQVTGHQLQCGEVTPLIGVTNLGDELRQLLQRLLAGCLSHPVQRLDGLAVGLQEVADQNQHLLLVCGREVHGHVLLTNLLTQSLLDSAHAALPALTNLLGTGKGLAVEVEAFLNQLVVHERRTRTQNSPHSPQLPAHQRDGSEQLRRTLKEGRLTHNNLTQGLRVSAERQ